MLSPSAPISSIDKEERERDTTIIPTGAMRFCAASAPPPLRVGDDFFGEDFFGDDFFGDDFFGDGFFLSFVGGGASASAAGE